VLLILLSISVIAIGVAIGEITFDQARNALAAYSAGASAAPLR
jgi:hypothetical protein